MSSQQVAGNNLEEETGWRMMDEDQRRGHHTSQVDEQEPSTDIEEFMLSERQAFDSRVDEETGWRLLDEQDQGPGGADLREDEDSQILDDKFEEVQLGGQEQQPQGKPETYQQQLEVVSDQQKAAIKHYFEAESEKLGRQMFPPEQQLDLERWEGEGGQSNFDAEALDADESRISGRGGQGAAKEGVNRGEQEASAQLSVAMEKSVSAEVADLGNKSLEKLTLEHLHKKIDAPRGLIPKGDFTGEPQTHLEASKAQASR